MSLLVNIEMSIYIHQVTHTFIPSHLSFLSFNKCPVYQGRLHQDHGSCPSLTLFYDTRLSSIFTPCTCDRCLLSFYFFPIKSILEVCSFRKQSINSRPDFITLRTSSWPLVPQGKDDRNLNLFILFLVGWNRRHHYLKDVEEREILFCEKSFTI